MATGSVFYAHGSGNRAADAKAYGAALEKGLKRPVALSTWGVSAGPDQHFPRLPLTMPTVAAAFGAGAGKNAAALADPYAPLRALSGGAAGAFAAGGKKASGKKAAKAAAAAKEDAKSILAFLQLGGVDLESSGVSREQLSAAATEVAASPEFAAAGGDPVALIDAAVTASVARAVQRQGPKAMAAGAFGFDPIGAIKESVAKAVMGGVGIIGSTVGLVSGPIAKWLSEQFAPRRQAIMQAHILVAADILFYQRHSDTIRAHVRGEIAKLPKPRLVMGHSLGGIILVDTLFGKDAVKLDVDLLITFGSQSPLLEALEAFDKVTPTVPWLNIWTKFDFVSFLAEGIWPNKVTDREIPNDLGFPEAHGSYYDSKAFYQEIVKHPVAAKFLK